MPLLIAGPSRGTACIQQMKRAAKYADRLTHADCARIGEAIDEEMKAEGQRKTT
jgi:hypothetical protein